jgi:hypothetical protein
MAQSQVNLGKVLIGPHEEKQKEKRKNLKS